MEQNTEASQAVDERADMIAALSMCAAALAQGSRKRSRDIACEYACEALRRAALKTQPAPTDPVAWMCPNDPDSASAFIWARNGVDYSNMSCDSCGGKHVPVYRQPAPTEAAQGEQIGWVNTKYGTFIPLSGLASTKRNSELLASRELIAVYGAGQLSGNSGELQPSGNTGELAQGEDSARLDAERYQWIRAAEWSDIESIFWSHAVQSGSSPEACQAELDAAIDRARASAETGGVKP